MLKISHRAAALCAVTAVAALGASQVAAQALKISRGNLAKTASFTVTTTTAPRGGSKVSQTMRVEVKGDKARVELNNPQIGPVTYLANEKGVFLYISANKLAQRQNLERDANSLLRFVFGQMNEQLKTAKRTGTATVSGQATDVYTDPKRGATLYIGRNPGFRLPIKTVLTNEGGTRTFLVSNIKTNIQLADARFAVPPGVRVIEASGAGASAPLIRP